MLKVKMKVFLNLDVLNVRTEVLYLLVGLGDFSDFFSINSNLLFCLDFIIFF